MTLDTPMNHCQWEKSQNTQLKDLLQSIQAHSIHKKGQDTLDNIGSNVLDAVDRREKEEEEEV